MRTAQVSLRVLEWIPQRPALGLAAALGRLVYRFDGRDRRLALKHLELAFGDEMSADERERVARESFASLGRGIAEIAQSLRDPKGYLNANMVIDGREHFDRLSAEGRAFVFVTGHIGNWELEGSAILNLLGQDSVAVARPQTDAMLEQILDNMRARLGIHIHSRGDDARALLKFLRDGRALSVLLDQDTDGVGCFVPFFGRPAYTLLGPAMLAVRTNSPFLVAHCRREADGQTLRVTIHEPIEPAGSGDREADAIEMTRAATAILEQAIRETPEQWVWIHNRWRRQPDDDDHGQQSRR